MEKYKILGREDGEEGAKNDDDDNNTAVAFLLPFFIRIANISFV